MVPLSARDETLATAAQTIAEILEATPLGVPPTIAGAAELTPDLLIVAVDLAVETVAATLPAAEATRVNLALNDAIDPVYDVWT